MNSDFGAIGHVSQMGYLPRCAALALLGGVCYADKCGVCLNHTDGADTDLVDDGEMSDEPAAK